MIRRSVTLFALGAAALVVQADHAAAVYNGEVGPTHHSVVAIGGSRPTCSGTVIHPSVVLTAAHCLSSPMPQRVFFGGDEDAFSSRRIIAAAVHPHYDRGRLLNDIALVLLDEPATVEPAALSRATVRRGEDIEIVGFGSSGNQSGTRALRRRGVMRTKAVTKSAFVAVPRPSSACWFDSGGPALVGGEVVGVISAGDLTCRGIARFTRIDVARAFVRTMLDPKTAQWKRLSDLGA